MGDRGNIVVLQHPTGHDHPTGGVFLYTHWGGTELKATLAAALGSDKGRRRWGDEPYLTRIIFDTLTQGRHDEETGFGISTYVCDNEHDLLVVDDESRRVAERPWSYQSYLNPIADDEGWDYEEFIAKFSEVT